MHRRAAYNSSSVVTDLMDADQKNSLWIVLIMLLAAAWKGIYLLAGVIPFNSDEAIVALMARHILQGARPIFFYGQAYMGSLDAWLAAAGFWLFGEQVWVIRLVQLLLYLGTIYTTYRIALAAFDSSRTGLIASLLLAIPAVNGTLYTTASLGGYGEALLLGNLMLLTALLAGREREAQPAAIRLAGGFFFWGLLAGLGLWANGLTLIYAVPSGLYMVWSLRRFPRRLVPAVLAALAGFLLGAAPWWLYALRVGPSALLGELSGGAVAVEKVNWLARTWDHLVNLVLLGMTALFGLRPPWEVRWLALPLLPAALAFWLGTLGFMIARLRIANKERAANGMLAGVGLMLAAAFLFTPFGVDPSGRYFLPLSVPLALGAGQMVTTLIRQRRMQLLVIGLVLVFQGWGTVQSALRFPPGLTTQFYEPSIIDHRYDQQLMTFLTEHGETRGYSSYWTAYPLAFLSSEEIIFVPALPYHPDLSFTPRDNRYAPYAQAVRSAEKMAYINARIPQVSAALRDRLTRIGVSWNEQRIGDYEIFYALSRPVHPEEIGFGLPNSGNP